MFSLLVSCPALLLTKSSLAGTPSPGPPQLKKTPAAGRPLPQGGEGRGSEEVLSTIKWDRTPELAQRRHLSRRTPFISDLLLLALTQWTCLREKVLYVDSKAYARPLLLRGYGEPIYRRGSVRERSVTPARISARHRSATA